MNTSSPLADRLRPQSFAEVAGQDHLLGPEGFITKTVQTGTPQSIILWGPPGSGKTTLARLYAKSFHAHVVTFSAVFSGVADLRRVVSEAQSRPLFQPRTILFVDEIHRFNKAQQDGFLPYIENGTFVLIGATTENPSFSLNDALLSRIRVLILNPLNPHALDQLLSRYEALHRPLPPEKRRELVEAAGGDGRYLLHLVENLDAGIQKRAAIYDRRGDGHYNLISALHKAVRGSDPDAALYWLARMLHGGEDPLFIARRLIRMATEDIGLADPDSLKLAVAARDAYQMLGSPEGELALAEVTIYLALAPKSHATYTAWNAAREQAQHSSHLPPPLHILNAPTPLMRQAGYGRGYQYDHDTPQGCSKQHYFPDGLANEKFYYPVARGFEREMQKRLDYYKKIRK